MFKCACCLYNRQNTFREIDQPRVFVTGNKRKNNLNSRSNKKTESKQKVK